MSEFKIIKEDRNSLAAEVYPDFQVIIKAPRQARDFEIDDFIKRKTLWIKNKLIILSSSMRQRTKFMSQEVLLFI